MIDYKSFFKTESYDRSAQETIVRGLLIKMYATFDVYKYVRSISDIKLQEIIDYYNNGWNGEPYQIPVYKDETYDREKIEEKQKLYCWNREEK